MRRTVRTTCGLAAGCRARRRQRLGMQALTVGGQRGRTAGHRTAPTRRHSKALAAHRRRSPDRPASASWSPTGPSTPTAPRTSASSGPTAVCRSSAATWSCTRAADGGWRGVSQTLRSRSASAPRPSSRPQWLGRARWPRRRRPGPSPPRAAGAPRLVVDAIAGTPRLAWQVTSVGRRADGTPSRLVDVRRRPHRQGASGARSRSQTVDGSGQSLYSGTVPLQLTQSGLDVPAQGPDPRQHLHDRHEQQGRTRSSARSSASGCTDRARCSPAPTAVRQRLDQQPRVGGRRRAVRHQRDLGLLQERARPQRHLRRRAPARSTGSTTAATTSTRSGTAPR